MNFVENNIFETLFDMIPFYVYVVDVNTYDILYLNAAFRDKLGDTANKKCYQAIFDYESPCYFCKINELFDENGIKAKDKIVFEQFNDFDERWYRMEEKGIYWPDGSLVKYSIVIDITEAKEAQNKLAEAHADLVLKSKELESKNKLLNKMYDDAKEMAEKDYLTGLYNRRYFYEIGVKLISNLIRQKRTGYFVVMDIDHFKTINDKYGHSVGDEVLQNFAEILKNGFRESDLVGRIGGEEFAVILLNINGHDAYRLLENLRDRIESQCVDIDSEIKVTYTVSIGVAKIDDKNFDSILSKADNMMYCAKEKGRNRVIFSE